MDVSMLDELEAQHREVEGLLQQLAGSDDASEQRKLTDKLSKELTRHMEIEETEVYPRLRRLDQEMDEEARIEHDLVRSGLEQLAGMIGKPGFGAAVSMVEAGILHHVGEEENEAFPQLRQAIESGRLDSGDTGGTSGRSQGEGGDGDDKELSRDELYEIAREKGIEGRSKMNKEELSQAVEG